MKNNESNNAKIVVNHDEHGQHNEKETLIEKQPNKSITGRVLSFFIHPKKMTTNNEQNSESKYKPS